MSLQSNEYNFFSVALNKTGNLTDLKREFYTDNVSAEAAAYPEGTGEILFLRKYIENQGGTPINNYRSDLYKQALTIAGITPTQSYNQNKNLFYSSSTIRDNYSITLQDYIKSLSGLVAYYPLDETSGNAINQAPDTLGSYDGTVTGATQGASGLAGNAYSFDGSGDKVVITHDANLNFASNKLTIFALVKQTGNASGLRTFIKKDSSYILRLENTSLNARFSYWNSTPTIKNLVDSALNSSWHMVVGRYDGDGGVNNHQIFVDGVSVAAGSQANENGSTATNNIGLGANPADASEGMVGLLQHVGIVKGALTNAQILRMAQLAGLT